MKTTSLIIKNIKLIIAIFGIIIPNFVFAQLNDNSAEILDGVAKKTKSLKTIKINFIFKHEKDKIVQGTINGSVWVKGDKYRYTFNNQIQYCDGATTWTYIEETNEVTINNANSEEDNLNPAFFFDDYKTKFKPRLIRETSSAGRMIYIIDLFPIKSQSYSRIRVEIDKLKQQLIQMTVIEKSGDIYTYSISSFVTNQEMDDPIFSFDASKHKNVEVIDMR